MGLFGNERGALYNLLSEKDIVWSKGQVVPGHDPNHFRKDDKGQFIRYDDYGDRSSIYGWEIDHIQASALGGHDGITNKRPLNWHSNAGHGGFLSGLLRP